ncbi:uncharacterized protein [Procambarus clarkii]|uniref:uncharacterized protein isoform X3 n=1 Tax=Procambarus clarkii TaxID=6728 RepID=UPI0037430ACC
MVPPDDVTSLAVPPLDHKDNQKHCCSPLIMDNNPEECSVCFNHYDDLLRPQCLPCGHTFCSQCIDKGIANVQLTCPACCTQHSATTAAQFPINYDMEALIRKHKSTQVEPLQTVAAKPYQGPARGISKMLWSLVEAQKNSISSLITACEEALAELGVYQGQLGDWKTQHLQLQDRLYGLVEQNKAAMELLELENISVVDMTTQGEAGKAQLQAMLGGLNIVNTAQEAITTIDTADHCNMEVEVWLQKCQELFPDVNAVHTSVKVDDLRRMSEPVKRLVEAGRVLAVQQDQDGCRSARITLQDGKLYLHPLMHQPMPAYAHTLQESEIVGLMNPSCPLVFLDLGWAGSTRGRVTIQLKHDVGLSRQFVFLCTGQRGHTYLNTKLLKVVGKGEVGEYVYGGDYESNDGKGGAPLLPNIEGAECKYWESYKAGTVWPACNPQGARSTQFAITTIDNNEWEMYSDIFGKVVSGLDVVREAVSHSKITEVTVVDCGIVLSY